MGFFGDLARGIRGLLTSRRGGGDVRGDDGVRGDGDARDTADRRRRRPTPLEMAGPGFAAGGPRGRRDAARSMDVDEDAASGDQPEPDTEADAAPDAED
ncbi:MAG: hypothetical protein KF727_10245 [Microbacteriaceae bacterium]|nr:hypothetical protein [Microbacteriaceae bacterium]